MFALKILNSKERKELLSKIKDQWGAILENDLVFLENNRQRVFVITRDIDRLDLAKLRINSMGLYFGELIEDKIRLSIEGAELVGPNASKNVVKVSKEQMRAWLQGNDIDVDTDADGFVILRWEDDFIGCGRCSRKKIKNFVPKTRRIKSDD